MPILRFVISPNRSLDKQKVQTLSLGIIVLLAALALYDTTPNHYKVLGVRNMADRPDIHAAFKKLEQTWHPDRSKRPGAAKHYEQLKESYDTLMNNSRRKRYIKFGDFEDVGDSDFVYVVATSVVTGILCYCVGFFFTSHAYLADCRQFIAVYLITITSVEMYLRFLDHKLINMIPIIGSQLVFEQVRSLRLLFPTFLAIGMYVSSVTYVDQKGLSFRLMRELIRSNNDITNLLREFTTSGAFAAVTKNAKTDDVTIPASKIPPELEMPEPSSLGLNIHKAIGLLMMCNYMFIRD